ncbi:Ig-like domain-containing protein [Fodinibius salinus]|uniref:Ig-like domain-containing protein n=1 Tax=Fodinibius salinus TaxID=860790 RepID=A0A5D3YQ68_9BACT|nr:Ig-like domain-containing protein [Fodinibius salinus]TYP95418.1 Ig-like domain-containing protein [Fodinibius salinus]
MRHCRLLGLATASVLLVVFSCATPSSPTGGPPDEEGPKIVRTEPETGTTNFDKQRIILHFSEFVERSSLQQAIVIEPGIGINYELDWGRKSVAVEFDEALPDSTTLILTVNTEFKDVKGNSMAEPYKVAVSTGPEIDEGSLIGRVLNAQTGKGRDGERILLYREPVDLSEQANYIASTDTSGQFQFSYLRQGRYKAFWVNDRNRNKIWDREQERAQPFGKEFFSLDKAETDTIAAIFKTPVDTTNPSLQGVGLFSSQRLRLRFSENIRLTDSTRIAVTDSTGTKVGGGYPLYIKPDEQFVLFAHSKNALSPSTTYDLDVRGIVDGFDNQLTEVSNSFTGSAQKDTTQQRIIERNNVSGYFPDDTIKVTYAKPIKNAVITDSLVVIEGNKEAKNWSGVKVRRNKLQLSAKEGWKEGVNYEVRVWDPIIKDYRKLSPKFWHDTQMGTLNIVTQDSTLKDVEVQIVNEESNIRRDSLFDGQVEIDRLPPLNYKVVAYRDLNGNNKWDFGQVDPFEAPEPYFIQQKVPVRKKMTGDLTIIFQ